MYLERFTTISSYNVPHIFVRYFVFTLIVHVLCEGYRSLEHNGRNLGQISFLDFCYTISIGLLGLLTFCFTLNGVCFLYTLLLILCSIFYY